MLLVVRRVEKREPRICASDQWSWPFDRVWWLFTRESLPNLLWLRKSAGILLGDLFLWFVGLSLNCGDDFLFFLIEVNFALDYCFVVESCSDQESYFGDTSSVLVSSSWFQYQLTIPKWGIVHQPHLHSIIVSFWKYDSAPTKTFREACTLPPLLCGR